MAFEPFEVTYLVGRCWGSKKKKNLASETLGDGISWADNVAVVEEVIEDCIRRSLTSPYQTHRANIARRIIIDKAARAVSDTPHFYSLPLYISENLLVEIENLDIPTRGSNRPKKISLPPHCREHTVPLAVHCSGEKILADPETCLINLRRAIASPISYVTKREDEALREKHVKSHEIPFYPFKRYDWIATVYRTDTGERIDPNKFTYRHHLDVMALHPAYASILPLVASGKNYWREKLISMRAECARHQGA
ncbi:MAG: hypothetical protein B7Y74_03815 [Novosphingobium sp. 35-62-5]|nr:MAG: hypothetical protein B7Y74_03815 [Novosphingobium sp. 35-62-5]